MGYKKKNGMSIFLSMLFNPIFILVYVAALYNFSGLCRVGKVKEYFYGFIACAAFFAVYLVVFIVLLVLNKKKSSTVNSETEMQNDSSSGFRINPKVRKVYYCIATVVLAVVTVFYGAKVYKSSKNEQLAFYLDDLFNDKKVAFLKDNIYKDNAEGFMTVVKRSVNLPDKLYVNDEFSIHFNKAGTITSIEGVLYGKDKKGKDKAYVIYYDSKKSHKIGVHTHEVSAQHYDESKSFTEFMKIMKVLDIEGIVKHWDENNFGILYKGKRDWGANTDGIRFMADDGSFRQAESIDAVKAIKGYTVSVYVPNKEDKYTPERFILESAIKREDDETDGVDDPANDAVIVGKTDDKKRMSISKTDQITETYGLTDKVGFYLKITDAAAGSRAYALYKTTDGGKNWDVFNEDPFKGVLGVSAGMTFIDDKIGFLGLSHASQEDAVLYRTEDGGKTYAEVDFPKEKRSIEEAGTETPFDFPGMPYEKDGAYYMEVGQGANGDYADKVGVLKALYKSDDKGKTWKYVKDVHEEKDPD